MNFSDSEVVASILKNKGYELTDNSRDASLILLNTCSIRDKAEQTVRNKLKNFNSLKKNNIIIIATIFFIFLKLIIIHLLCVILSLRKLELQKWLGLTPRVKEELVQLMQRTQKSFE